MIFVFRPAGSSSARLLAEAVDGVRIKREENLIRRAKPNDKVVMWGAYVPNITAKTLNNVPLRSKYDDAVKLKAAGVRTVEVALTRPVATSAIADPLIAIWNDAQAAAEDFVQLDPVRNEVAQAGVQELRTKMTNVLNAMRVPAPVAPPAQPVGEWIGRSNAHRGGSDILGGIVHPDFYSKKEAFINEYRVHSFFGKSIRAGRKVHRTADDETPFTGIPHEWVRSFDGGWKISYADGVGVKQKHRDIAHQAVKALGLNFGAVDIGELADGTLVVLEVNRAAGVEGGTTEAYSRAIRKWITGEWTTDGGDRVEA